VTQSIHYDQPFTNPLASLLDKQMNEFLQELDAIKLWGSLTHVSTTYTKPEALAVKMPEKC